MASGSRLGAGFVPAFIPSSHWTIQAQLPGNKLKVFSCWFVPLLGLLCGGLCCADSDFSILEEAQVLAVQMKKLSAQELGVFTMQVNSHTCAL
ncbi:VWFA and cache domain-containing protein 1 isoform X1 [Tachysurus ichikawai]